MRYFIYDNNLDTIAVDKAYLLKAEALEGLRQYVNVPNQETKNHRKEWWTIKSSDTIDFTFY